MIATKPVRDGIAPVSHLLAALRTGRACVLLNDRERRDEGVVIMGAQHTGAAAVTFMALHARGLVCLALTPDKARSLQLGLQPGSNSHAPAFAASIEAREGVSTGISAHDRARTIQVACNPASAPTDLVSPGHVFPVIAAPGGVAERAAHAEGAIDLCRLAGLAPAATWCVILDGAGDVARCTDLLAFGKRHDLPVGRMTDLIAYRAARERRVARVHDQPFETRYGPGLTLTVFRDSSDAMEHVALWRRGEAQAPALLKVESVDFVAGLINRELPGTSRIDAALAALMRHPGSGALILVRRLGLDAQAVAHDDDLVAKIALALCFRRVIAESTHHVR